jgi:hypothetical protein
MFECSLTHEEISLLIQNLRDKRIKLIQEADECERRIMYLKNLQDAPTAED